MDLLTILSVGMIFTSLAVFGLRNYKLSIFMYAVQTLLLVLIFWTLAVTYDASQLFAWAVIAFITKVILVPYILLGLVRKLNVTSEVEPVTGFFVSPIIAMGFSLASAMAIYPIYLKFSLIQEKIPLIASIVIFMMGIFGFILRRSVIKQILAFCMFENGIHLSLAIMAYNSPEIVELGVLTDAIFAVLIMSVLATRFYKYFNSLDVSKANTLKG